MRWKLSLILALIATILIAPLCAFTVDRTEYVYLTQFGAHLETFDGDDDEQHGVLGWRGTDHRNAGLPETGATGRTVDVLEQ